uniref:Movement protein n=4 Tax=Raspberry rubodvirus 1 TaxID=3231632 RepID=A0AAU8JNR3_9VIRU
MSSSLSTSMILYDLYDDNKVNEDILKDLKASNLRSAEYIKTMIFKQQWVEMKMRAFKEFSISSQYFNKFTEHSKLKNLFKSRTKICTFHLVSSDNQNTFSPLVDGDKTVKNYMYMLIEGMELSYSRTVPTRTQGFLIVNLFDISRGEDLDNHLGAFGFSFEDSSSKANILLNAHITLSDTPNLLVTHTLYGSKFMDSSYSGILDIKIKYKLTKKSPEYKLDSELGLFKVPEKLRFKSIPEIYIVNSLSFSSSILLNKKYIIDLMTKRNWHSLRGSIAQDQDKRQKSEKTLRRQKSSSLDGNFKLKETKKLPKTRSERSSPRLNKKDSGTKSDGFKKVRFLDLDKSSSRETFWEFLDDEK